LFGQGRFTRCKYRNFKSLIMKYKLISKGPFEKAEKFEARLNQMAMEGWRVVTSMSQGAYLVLGKEKY